MRWKVAVVLALGFGGCTCKAKPKDTPAPPIVKPAPSGSGSAPAGSGSAAPALKVNDVEGYWTGDWGQLVFRQKDGKLLAAYNHDQGTITGSIVDGKFVGWWCEVPSRKGPHDAGDVEMTFVTDAAGKRTIDGRWRYGADGDWHDDWDIAFDAGAPADELVKRFDDPAAFCPKP